jgi:hypothetical protein
MLSFGGCKTSSRGNGERRHPVEGLCVQVRGFIKYG